LWAVKCGKICGPWKARKEITGRNNGCEIYGVFSGCFEGKSETVKAKTDKLNKWDFKESQGEKINKKEEVGDERRESKQQ
jgi:hypothetical protein